jgi:hypothetical protein
MGRGAEGGDGLPQPSAAADAPAASSSLSWKNGSVHASRVRQSGFIEVYPRSVSFKVRPTRAPRVLVSTLYVQVLTVARD